eukprot:6160817-Pyramimonas_sp.AAC.2
MCIRDRSLDLPVGAEPRLDEAGIFGSAPMVLHMAQQSTYAQIELELNKQRSVRGQEARVIEVRPIRPLQPRSDDIQ